MGKILGVEWAPVWIPLKRRIEMMIVVFYCSMFVILPVCCCLAILMTIFTPLFIFPLCYLTWIFYDEILKKKSCRGGRRWEWFKGHPIWKHFRDYFPVSLIKTTDLDPEKRYIFGYHPHGILGFGALCNFATYSTGFPELFPGITPYLMTLKENFCLPVSREFLLWQGVCAVSKESIQWILTKEGKGAAAVIVIGGAEESLASKPGAYTLTLRSRKGFVKQAIKAGASLVPVFSFGENELFEQADNPDGSRLRRFQNKFKKMLGFAPPIFYGRGVFNYNFGLLPFRLPIKTVVGKPIDVEQCDDPSQEMIDKYHTQYIEELTNVFENYKTEFGISESKKLDIR